MDSNVVPVTTKRSYTDVLPSFNFILDVTDAQKVRFSAARWSRRRTCIPSGWAIPTTSPAARIRYQNARFHFAGGSSGNPNLDPYRASQFLL